MGHKSSLPLDIAAERESTMTNIHLGDIRYNAQSGAFEARVDIHTGGRTYGYPCAIEAPLTQEPARVRSSLIAQAEARAARRNGLRSVL